MRRQFTRRLLTMAGVLVLAFAVLAAAASAAVVGAESPQAQMTNTGELRTLVFQGHHLTPPGDRGDLSILYAPSEADNATFRSNLATCTGATVDYFDPRTVTPDVALLSGYDMVIVWGNYAFADPVLYGDNLADYVDGGGQVVLGQWCIHTNQVNWLEGRIMTAAYCPITATGYGSATYNMDGTDCVHDGVAVYSSDYTDVCTAISGAVSDGTFNNATNSLAVAWRADRMVYYSPGNTGTTYGTGDWATVTCKMFLCAGGTETYPLIVTGPGATVTNPPRVRVWVPDDTSAPVGDWSAYGVDQFGVNVACGDVIASGHDVVITGAGPGAVFGPHVRGFADDGTPIASVSFLAYGTNKYGVNVACGDVDNDGYDEIITGAGPGAVFGPHVRGWNVDGGTPAAIGAISYFAYGTPKWGVNVTCGDIDGDGYEEIVTGAGPGTVYGPHVRGWNYDGNAIAPIGGVSFLAYGTNQFGVNVACGDIDGDGIDEIITGAGPGVVFGPHVRGWNVDGGAATSISGVSFFAYSGALYGVSVATLDVDDDGYDEIITMPGPDPSQPPLMRGWNVDGGTAALITTLDFDAYSDMVLSHGGKIAGGNF